MDQAVCAHQALPGHERKRGENANPVRRVHRRAHCHCKEGAPPQCLALYVATDLVGLNFREIPDFMRIEAQYDQNYFAPHSWPINLFDF